MTPDQDGQRNREHEQKAAGFPQPPFRCVVRSLDLANVGRREPLRALGHAELHTITVREGLEAVAFNRGEVDEHVVPALLRDEAKALRLVEPLHGASIHFCSFRTARGLSPWSNAVQARRLRPVLLTGARPRRRTTSRKKPPARSWRPVYVSYSHLLPNQQLGYRIVWKDSSIVAGGVPATYFKSKMGVGAVTSATGPPEP